MANDDIQADKHAFSKGHDGWWLIDGDEIDGETESSIIGLFRPSAEKEARAAFAAIANPLSPSELATILYALRRLQSSGGVPESMSHKFHFTDVRPIDGTGISLLCERLEGS